jgi:hypothetical protein
LATRPARLFYLEDSAFRQIQRSLGVNSVSELMAHAKQKPSEPASSASGNGMLDYVILDKFKTATIDMIRTNGSTVPPAG